jgi:succinate dehydrogenase flavin-adding protein (antitoxin of CptAB toxin-antitoxin module)
VAYCHGNIANTGAHPLKGETFSDFPEEEWRRLAQNHPSHLPPGPDSVAVVSGRSNEGHEGGQDSNLLSHEQCDTLRKKLKWGACKRGWNEMGILLEGFVHHDGGSSSSSSSSSGNNGVAAGLALMDSEELMAFDRLIKCDDMFITDLISGRKEVPPELSSPVFERLKVFASEQGGSWKGREGYG